MQPTMRRTDLTGRGGPADHAEHDKKDQSKDSQYEASDEHRTDGPLWRNFGQLFVMFWCVLIHDRSFLQLAMSLRQAS